MELNLYKLPKDILVKMICQIREDTIKEFNVYEMKEQLNYLKVYDGDYCDDPNCYSFGEINSICSDHIICDKHEKCILCEEKDKN